MVDRYRPQSTRARKSPSEGPEPRFPVTGELRPGRGVGRASVKKATIDRVEKEGRQLRKDRTADAFQNFSLNIGLGTNNALSQSQYGFYPVTRVRTMLDWIYRGSWFGGIAVDIPAEDMTRGGVEIISNGDPQDSERVQQGLTRLQIWQKLADAVKWSRLYGGCLAVMLVDGQDPSTPLRIDTVGRNQFKGLMVLDRWMVDPDLQRLVSAYGPNLGLPEYYRVVTDAPAMRNQQIHYTRCVRLSGVKLPYWQAVMENLWGCSVFERLYDRMLAFDSATMGAAQLVYKSYLRTYKINGLNELLSQGGEAAAGIQKRVELMRKYQGIEGITLLDGKDEFAAHSNSSFSGIADVLLHFGEQLSGSLQVPLVRLFGQSPAGLNSSGESDLRTYYDGISQSQERDLRDGVNTILRLLARSSGITLDDSFNFNFVPLWQLNEDEKSQVSDRDTRAALEVEAAGLISKQVALKELRQGSRVTGRWTNITDEMIAAASDLAGPPAPELEPETEGEGAPAAEALSGAQGGFPVSGRGAPTASEEQQPLSPLEGLKELRAVKGLIGKDGVTHPFTNAPRGAARDELPFALVGGELNVVIETPKGSVRRGPGFAIAMPADYGFIRRVGSAEGPEEWLDCFVGPDRESREVWIVDAFRPESGTFDEHKVLLGFVNAKDAVNCFKTAYHDNGSGRMGAVSHLTLDDPKWRDFLQNGDKLQPYARTLRTG